jgi:hypothetical protein
LRILKFDFEILMSTRPSGTWVVRYALALRVVVDASRATRHTPSGPRR